MSTSNSEEQLRVNLSRFWKVKLEALSREELTSYLYEEEVNLSKKKDTIIKNLKCANNDKDSKISELTINSENRKRKFDELQEDHDKLKETLAPTASNIKQLKKQYPDLMKQFEKQAYHQGAYTAVCLGNYGKATSHGKETEKSKKYSAQIEKNKSSYRDFLKNLDEIDPDSYRNQIDLVNKYETSKNNADCEDKADLPVHDKVTSQLNALKALGQKPVASVTPNIPPANAE
uniref:Uncharacterized protein n=1 Tax=viral metagenome TaxID=1070528 RepID=A0A6C0FBC0_9ZZZZ|tara:strand:+ start:4015 stop:4710 length:696 start_codon:yes stop_codon:yes gene_type:complete